MNTFSADPDFSKQVVDDLYRYKHKYQAIALVLVIFFGLLGAHRFYMNKPLSATLMLLSAGGGLIWWVVDIIYIKRIVSRRNSAEKERLENGEAPSELSFLPPKKALKIDKAPAWTIHRNSRARIYGSLFLLSLVGFILGVVSGSSGTFEPSIILIVFIVASLSAARWKATAKIPVVYALTRWVHRLRLYYYSVDPGNIWLLGLRPIYGLFVAPFFKKTRAEVGLYLELGVFFSLVFLALDIVEILQYESLWVGISLSIAELIQTIIYTFLFVAPVGALLTTQILLSRSDRVIWLLSLACVFSIYLGFEVVGAI